MQGQYADSASQEERNLSVYQENFENNFIKATEE